jgi:hypothetical protein
VGDWRRGAICWLLVLTSMASLCSCSTEENIADTADVFGAIEITTSMGIEPSNDTGRAAEIRWSPAYIVANRGEQPFELMDITIDFPSGVLPDGRTVDLLKISKMRAVAIYPTSDEAFKQRPVEVRDPPISIGPGVRLYVQAEEALILTLDGAEFPLKPDANLIDFLGPVLRLAQEGDGYRCAVQRKLPAVLQTNRGEVRREVIQPLLPVGCTLNIPEPTPGN